MTPISTALLPGSGCSSVSNSTTETDLVSINIVADSLSDGDNIDLISQIDFLNNSGSSGGFTSRLYFGSDAYQITVSNHGSGSTVYSKHFPVYLWRAGTSLYVSTSSLPSAASSMFQQEIAHVFTPDFTIDNVLKITIQPSAANANLSATANHAKVVQY